MADIEIIVNGSTRQVPDGLTAEQLLERLSVKKELVVVELNLNILKRHQLAGAALKAGDRVEIVQLAGGG